MDRLGDRVGELRRTQSGQYPRCAQGSGKQVHRGLDAVSLGECGQLAAGELSGEVGDQQRPSGQDGRAVHGQQRLPSG
jgi:hypothetical protein